MIKANELRLGNLFSLWMKTRKVEQIHIDGVVFAEVGFMRLCEIEPIPLTPEILTEFGFSANGFHEFEFQISEYSKLVLDLRQGYLWLRENDISKRPENDSIVCLWNRDFKKDIYLHQFQNLYFALTGEELEITL